MFLHFFFFISFACFISLLFHFIRFLIMTLNIYSFHKTTNSFQHACWIRVQFDYKIVVMCLCVFYLLFLSLELSLTWHTTSIIKFQSHHLFNHFYLIQFCVLLAKSNIIAYLSKTLGKIIIKERNKWKSDIRCINVEKSCFAFIYLFFFFSFLCCFKISQICVIDLL